jgi:hypothetical protein
MAPKKAVEPGDARSEVKGCPEVGDQIHGDGLGRLQGGQLNPRGRARKAKHCTQREAERRITRYKKSMPCGQPAAASPSPASSKSRPRRRPVSLPVAAFAGGHQPLARGDAGGPGGGGSSPPEGRQPAARRDGGADTELLAGKAGRDARTPGAAPDSGVPVCLGVTSRRACPRTQPCWWREGRVRGRGGGSKAALKGGAERGRVRDTSAWLRRPMLQLGTVVMLP